VIYGGNSTLTPVNARTIRLTGSIGQYRRTLDESKEIIALQRETIDGDILFRVGDVVKYKTSIPYKINVISPVYNTEALIGYDFSIAKLTKSAIFIAPLLGGSRKLFLWDKYFVNAFMHADGDSDVICLLYRFSGDMLFIKFEAALEKFPSFIRKFDPDPYHVMYIFDIPEGSKSSYQKFKEGKYSEIDDMCKLKILDYHGFTNDGQTAQILFKSPSLKKQLEEELETTLSNEQELHSVPNIEEETFNKEYYSLPKFTIK
jgi:hypothetical protein